MIGVMINCLDFSDIMASLIWSVQSVAYPVIYKSAQFVSATTLN